MRFTFSEQVPCPTCGWENVLLRKKCRNCDAVLTAHPNRDIDREVRQDQAEAHRLEQSLGLR